MCEVSCYANRMGMLPKPFHEGGFVMAYSIIDVAKRANTSKSTVSRVINGGSVSEKAKIAVLSAIDEMEYHPNGMARGLRGMKSKVIGVLTLGTNAFEDASSASRFAGMNNVFINSGYSMLLINDAVSYGESTFANAFRFLQESRVDGLIFIGAIDSEEDRYLASKYREIVYTGERIQAKKGFRVYMGNYHYSRDLYSYLVSNGHVKILTVATHINSEALSRRRRAAYKEVCDIFSVPCNSSAFLNLQKPQNKNEERLETIYQQFTKGEFTAIFADSMTLARAIVTYFATKNLTLLKDYSLVAIERSGVRNKIPEETITSICLSDYVYGQQCAELMLDVLEHPEMTIKDIIIPYSFHIRKSVRNIGNH